MSKAANFCNTLDALTSELCLFWNLKFFCGSPPLSLLPGRVAGGRVLGGGGQAPAGTQGGMAVLVRVVLLEISNISYTNPQA